METTIEIITKIHQAKKAKNIVPDFVTKKEIWDELFKQMETDLDLLCQQKKLAKGETARTSYYKLTEP